MITFVDEYGSSIVQIEGSLPKLRNRDKKFSSEQSQYTLLGKREVDNGLKGRYSTSNEQSGMISGIQSTSKCVNWNREKMMLAIS